MVNIERWDVIRQSSKSLHYLYEVIISKEYENVNKVKLSAQGTTYQEFERAQKEIHSQIQEGPIIKANNLSVLFATIPITLKNMKKQREIYNDDSSIDNNLKPESVPVYTSAEPTEDLLNLLNKARDNTDHIIFTEVYQKAIPTDDNAQQKVSK